MSLSVGDIKAVAERIKKLEEEDAMEASLCLLSSLLPYQLRLDVLANKPESSLELKELSKDFTAYLRALRVALVGS
jgi:hypothetical protein